MLLERADEGTNAAVVFLVAASESQRLATLLTRRAQETLGPESSADILAARQAEFRTDLAKSIEVGTFLRQLGRKEESAVSRVQDFFHQAPPWSRASASSDSRENPALDNAARKRLQYFLRASSAAPGRGGHEQPQETDVGAALDAFDGAVELVSDGKRLDLSKMLHLLMFGDVGIRKIILKDGCIFFYLLKYFYIRKEVSRSIFGENVEVPKIIQQVLEYVRNH